MVFNADATLLASRSDDGTIKIWDFARVRAVGEGEDAEDDEDGEDGTRKTRDMSTHINNTMIMRPTMAFGQRRPMNLLSRMAIMFAMDSEHEE